MTRPEGKPRKPFGIAMGFLIALVLSTATIIFTGLQVTSLSSRHAAERAERAEQAADAPPPANENAETGNGENSDDSGPGDPEDEDEDADANSSTNGLPEDSNEPGD